MALGMAISSLLDGWLGGWIGGWLDRWLGGWVDIPWLGGYSGAKRFYLLFLHYACMSNVSTWSCVESVSGSSFSQVFQSTVAANILVE